VTCWRLIQRGLVFYRRTHLGVVLGCAVATAVLVGALLVGDSVHFSLRRMALSRLGQTHLALVGQGRFFREALAGELGRRLGAPAAAVLVLPGIAVETDRGVRVNRVQVVGAGAAFWGMGRTRDPFAGADGDEVVLNERLARRLGVGAGDEVLLRIAKPSFMPVDAPLAGRSGESFAARLTVRAVAGEAAFGRFGLQANQVEPFNAFVPLAWLQVGTSWS